MILGYLLHNPELEKATSIWPSGARQKYGLTPAILQACQQLYIEGHHVLYDHKFYFACLSDSAEHESPLTRYIHSIKGESLRDHPAIKYINRCIVVIGGERRSYNNSFSPRPLTDFCRSAHYMPLTGREALEVCVLLKGMAGDVKLEGISKLLAPLKLMRLQYGVLEIRDAKS